MDTKRERDKIRFWSKVEKVDSGCREWRGSFFKTGYGQFFIMECGKERTRKASRVAYEFTNGALPAYAMVLHKCHNRKCVNPEHLYLGDHTRNMLDRAEANRTNKWDKRYNFVQTPELEEKVKAMRLAGERIGDICSKLNIGRTTYYRLRARGVIDLKQDRDIARANYQSAARAR